MVLFILFSYTFAQNAKQSNLVKQFMATQWTHFHKTITAIQLIGKYVRSNALRQQSIKITWPKTNTFFVKLDFFCTTMRLIRSENWMWLQCVSSCARFIGISSFHHLKQLHCDDSSDFHLVGLHRHTHTHIKNHHDPSCWGYDNAQIILLILTRCVRSHPIWPHSIENGVKVEIYSENKGQQRKVTMAMKVHMPYQVINHNSNEIDSMHWQRIKN